MLILILPLLVMDLQTGHACFGRSANADAFLGFSAEL